ncbi:hypothetical protein [Azospirillum sp. sgz301742]
MAPSTESQAACDAGAFRETADTLLEQFARKHGASKMVHDYLKRYDQHFHQRRHDVRRIIEIGLQAPHQSGSSVHMWEDYFPNAVVHGIDINPACRGLEGGRVKISILNSADGAAVDAFIRENGSDFDLIIDDGSHWYQDQIDTFRNFFPHVRRGGHYVVEDLVSGDGPHRYIAVNAFKELVDGINYFPADLSTGWWQRLHSLEGGQASYVRDVVAVSFYRYMAVVEKGRNPEDNRFLTCEAPAVPISIKDTSARTGGGVEKLRRVVEIARALRKRHFIPAKAVRAPSFLDRLLGRIR